MQPLLLLGSLLRVVGGFRSVLGWALAGLPTSHDARAKKHLGVYRVEVTRVTHSSLQHH